MCPLMNSTSLIEPPGRPAPSGRKSAGVPDLAARCTTPVSGNGYVLARRLDINRVAERARLGCDAGFSGSRGHEVRLSPFVSLSHPLFGYPLMADGPEIKRLIAPAPRGREHQHRNRDTHAQDDPRGIHERRSVPARAIAETSSHRGMTMGGTRPITASTSALGLDDVPAMRNASRVSEVAPAAKYKRK